jgi:hypothetical protein
MRKVTRGGVNINCSYAVHIYTTTGTTYDNACMYCGILTCTHLTTLLLLLLLLQVKNPAVDMPVGIVGW